MTEASTAPRRSRVASAFATLAALASALAVLYVGITDHGIYHPDEIYQTLEPAHRFVFGSGLRAWEWEVGARNLTLPGLLVLPLGISKLLGLETSPTHLWPVAAWMAISAAATVGGVYRLARNWNVQPWYAAAGAVAFAALPAGLYFGHRPLPEVLSAPFVVWGIALGVEPSANESEGRDRSRTVRLVGLSLLGFAVLLRLQNALLCLVVAVIYRWSEPRDRYLDVVRTFAVWGLLYGAVDFIAWGVPFRSAGAYLRFNVLMAGTTDYYGASPVSAYASGYVDIAGIAGIAVVLCSLAALRRARRVWWIVGVFLLAHQLFPHRQLRFVYAAFPLMAALAAVGLQVLADRWSPPRWGAAAAAMLLGAGSAATTIYRWPRLEFGDLEQARTLDVEPSQSAHHFRDDVNRLLADAGRRPDLCGLKIARYWAVQTGGQTYLHRNVPIYHRLQPAPDPAVYNYVLRPRSTAPTTPSDTDDETNSDRSDGRVVASRGDAELVDTGRDNCRPDADYVPRVFRPK